MVSIISQCQSEKGGYCGGPFQYQHLAPTYAAVLSLIEIGTDEAYYSINRKSMYNFLMKTRSQNHKGCFQSENKLI